MCLRITSIFPRSPIQIRLAGTKHSRPADRRNESVHVVLLAGDNLTGFTDHADKFSSQFVLVLALGVFGGTENVRHRP